jgi:hypothetical protein
VKTSGIPRQTQLGEFDGLWEMFFL